MNALNINGEVNNITFMQEAKTAKLVSNSSNFLIEHIYNDSDSDSDNESTAKSI